MKKPIMLLVVLPLLVLTIAGTSYGWQGRMEGMGDPYGLILDESDFLINPAWLAKGEGERFYGDYRFTYTRTTDWDYNLAMLDTSGAFLGLYHFDTSGNEYKHNALLGAAFPFGPGRMGLFFTYDGMRGYYDGNEDFFGTSNFAQYNLNNNLDNFALRAMYGLSVLKMNAGIELGLAYRNEGQKTWWNQSDMVIGTQNYIWSFSVPERNLLPFMIPYDSHYWELMWKAGIQKQLGALGISGSLRGGAIVSSDNDYKYLYQMPVGANLYNADLNGGVTGWRIGSDIWFRYAIKEGLTLPFLVSVDYAKKKRDGNGIGSGSYDLGLLYDYTHKEQSIDIKAGGGIEKKFGNNGLVGAGLYYNYLRGRDDFRITRNDVEIETSDNSDFPFHQEHRVIVRLAGELALSSAVTLRMGLSPFYGWITGDFKHNDSLPFFSLGNDVSLDGSHWGINGSLGGSIKFKPFILEPFITGGWQQIKLDGSGDRETSSGTITQLYGMNQSRSEWFICGGFSVRFDHL